MEKGKGAKLSFTTTPLQLFSFFAPLTVLVAWMLFQTIINGNNEMALFFGTK